MLLSRICSSNYCISLLHLIISFFVADNVSEVMLSYSKLGHFFAALDDCRFLNLYSVYPVYSCFAFKFHFSSRISDQHIVLPYESICKQHISI